MNKDLLWLIGAGSIAQDYAKVLSSLKQPFKVIGRGESSALSFKKTTGISVSTGGLNVHLKKNTSPYIAIVAVGVEQLANTTKDLIRSGTKRILLEKPGALNLEEINSIYRLANKKKAEVYIAYNRRFYHSVEQLRRFVDEDGGLLSMNFEFTEWGHIIKDSQNTPEVKNYWLMGNSSHVIDLAFHLCGKPKDWKCWHKGKGVIDWHPTSARFCGSGITDRGVMFSYLSDWQAPGRWGLELMTAKRRFILRPMEKLQVVKLGSVLIQFIEPENKIDYNFKPGLFNQTKKFLEGDNYLMCPLSEQVKDMKVYNMMAGYAKN